MTAVLLGRHEPNTPEWDQLRSAGLGGSEVAAVVGLSPWVSRFALFHRKRGSIGKQEVNRSMDWGTRLEPVVCQAWAERHEMLDLVEGGTYRHHERTWQIANPDRILYDDEFLPDPVGLLETKTADKYDGFEWGHGPEDIPPYYRCQVVWYMDVFGVKEHHLAVLIGGNDYREYVIPYVPDEAEWLREQGRVFWQDVLADKAPPIDGHDATFKAVKALHPDIEKDVEVELTPQEWAEYEETRDEADAATTEHKRVKAAVLDRMGQANYAHVDGTRVLRRQPGRGGSVSLYPVKQPKHATEGAA